MPGVLTRINNNQITDASSGNVYLGIDAGVKLQNFTVTGGKLANNLTYSSNLTISGNLTVNGNTTTIDTYNLVVNDPLILLADGQTGSPTLDIGYIGERGSSQNIAFVWNEANGQFATVFTNSAITNTVISIDSYADFRAANITGGNISVTGTVNLSSISASGNIQGANLLTGGLLSAGGNVTGGNIRTAGLVTATGNVTGGNLTTAGAVTATGNVTGGNVTTAGLMSATGNVTGGNLTTAGLVSATGNVTGGNVTTAGLVSATGNVTGGNLLFGSGYVSGTGNVYAANFIGNISGNIDAAGANTQVQFNDTGDLLGASANFTFDKSTNTMTVSNGNVVGGNLLTGGLISATSTITSAANITGANLLTGGLISATGSITSANGITATANVTGGNLTTAGLVTATGNVTGGNLVTGGAVTATGNVTGGNILTAGAVSATGNVNGGNLNSGVLASTGGITIKTASNGNITLDLNGTGNLVLNDDYINGVKYPVQDQDAASKIYVDNMVSTQLSYHQAVTAATTTTLAATTGGTITYSQPNGAGNGVGATITTTGAFNLIDTANVQTANTRILVKNEANAVLNGIYYWANATAIIRTTDADEYGPNSAEALSINDYFFVTSGNVNAGSAYIVDSPSGVITFGTSNIQFAQFSSSQVYSANTSAGISLLGTVFSAKVDNNTTAFDGGGNISVKAGANLTTPNIGAATGTSLSVTGAVQSASVSASGNVTGGNVTTAGAVTATGNIQGGNLLTGGVISATGSITTAGGVTATGNVTGGNVTTAGLVTATGNVTGGNLTTAGAVTATGNVTGGNVTTAGLISATGNITGGNVSTTLLSATTVSASGNITGGNLLFGSGYVSGTGNVYAANFIGNISGNIDAAGANTQVQFNDTGDILGANANFTYNKVTNVLTVSGGNVSTGNVLVTTAVSAGGNVTGGNLLTAGLMSATGNVTGGNVTTAGLVSATGNVTGGNILGTKATFGTSLTPQACSTVTINATDSILMPVGNTVQRPSSTAIGMLRYNTSGDSLEVYTSTGWQDVGVPAFTVITDQQFSGTGACTTFTLSANSTTAATIVSINGVVQIPTTAYAVTGNSLVFTEAPAVSDLIDVRSLTTTTTVTNIENSTANAVVQALETAATIQITGNLLPAANVTYDVGSNTRMWKDAYFSGNTIYLGGLQMKASGNTFVVYTSDGVTQANIDAGSIDVSAISSGTSTIGIGAPNGNAYLAPAGSNALVASSTGVFVTGVLSATGNITGNFIFGNGSQLTGIDATSIQSGTSNVKVVSSGGNVTTGIGGTSNVVVVSSTGQFVTGVSSASGNVTGGNVLTAGLISATGNITGSFILGNGSQLTGIDATSIQSGTSNVRVVSAGGNVATGIGGTSNVVVVSSTGQFVTGVSSASGNVTGGNLLTAGLISATGSITSAGGITATANVTGGNITTAGLITATGNITGGNLSVGTGTVNVGNIVNTNANGVGNIGSASLYYNTVFAKATSAQYADLAEMYEADGVIDPGTVVAFGGNKEVTQCNDDACKRVAGVVSTNPSYIMNAGLFGENVTAVALTGRVPTKVVGTIRKGDMLVSAGNGRARAEADPAVGTVIGKALADFDGAEGTIEVVVGRL